MRSKYGNRKTVVDGITFASKAEAARYVELKIMRDAGVIWNLELQPKFELVPKFTDAFGAKVRAATYSADFRYVEPSKNGFSKWVVEDVKGNKTEKFILQWKMVRWQHRNSQGVVFRLVNAKDVRT